MPDLTVSADIDLFMQAANDAAARTELGLTALATTTPGTGVAAALAANVGSAGAPVLFNGAGGTPSSIVLTNATGTAAGLTAGTASAVAVGGITGLGTGVGAALAANVGSAGAPVLFNGAGGTPSSMVGTNITGTAAGLTAGAASSVAVGGITGLGANVATFLATPSSANLAAAVTGEVGSGALVFGTSPTFTTSVVTDSATLAVFNTVATTVNAFGVATALNIGAGAATILNFGGFTSAAELRFLEPSGSGTNYSGFKQPALAASITYLLPSDAPTDGQFLSCLANGTLSWESPAGAGTVTDVSWTGGIVSIANSTSTPAFTIAGTSGGVPYFNSGTTWATSAALAANALVIGGGAGAAPATTTTGTGVLTALGINVGSAGGIVTQGNVNIEKIGFTIDGGGSAISTGKVKGFFVCPYAGTIAAWSITVDTGTATMKVWKIADGTAKPTVANSINTSGVSISSGTNIRSTTLTDFTSTAVAANDIFAFEITAVSGATEMSGGIQINKT